MRATMDYRISIEEMGGKGLDRAQKLLAGLSGGVEKAVNATMHRTVSSLRTNAHKEIRKEYAISASALRMNENVRVSWHNTGRSVNAEVLFKGQKIPLYRYSATLPKAPRKLGRIERVLLGYESDGTTRIFASYSPGAAVRTKQMVSSSPTTFQNAFIAQFKSGHIGMFERTDKLTATNRFKLKEFMGSSVPQMLRNEDVLKGLSENIKETFDKRIEHDIDRILAGFR